MTLRTVLLALTCSAALAGTAHAQDGRSQQGQQQEVPKSYLPPRGMCRIWLDRVPAKQQPAPTDCPTAVRNRPPNGRVLFGDDKKIDGEKSERREPPFLRKFREERKKP